MNCKPGDLAIRIKAWPNSSITEGDIVRVLRYRPTHKLFGKDGLSRSVESVWDVEFRGDTRHSETGRLWGVPDAHLRPIRPGETPEESIETMRLLTLIPSEVTA